MQKSIKPKHWMWPLLNNMALEYWNTCTIQGNTDASISKVSVNKSRSHFFKILPLALVQLEFYLSDILTPFCKKNVDIINTEQCKTQHKHRLHSFYTVPTKTTLILLTLLTESRCACNFRPNSGSACPKFLTARSRINFWVLIRWFPMFSTNRSLSSGFSTCTWKSSSTASLKTFVILISLKWYYNKIWTTNLGWRHSTNLIPEYADLWEVVFIRRVVASALSSGCKGARLAAHRVVHWAREAVREIVRGTSCNYSKLFLL